MGKFEHFGANTSGRDFAVGDIHGHFTRLESAMHEAGFDASRDRLFSVGDLVDRGPENLQALDWLAQPWFFAVQGNHEALAIAHVQNRPLDYRMYLASGGSWFLELTREAQARFATRFAQMPIAMEIETTQGLIGVVHADCPLPSWDMLRATLKGHMPAQGRLQESCQWSRERLQLRDYSGISDLRAMVVGHTPLSEPEILGNVFHIDTGGWRSSGDGYFTLLELEPLTMNTPTAPSA